MPPITSMTMSMSGRVARPIASVVSSAGSTPGRGCESRRTAMPSELEPRAGPHGEVVGLLGEQPRDLGADDAAAEQRHPEHLAGFIFAKAHPTSNRSRSSSVSRRTISRAAPSATATTPGRGRWL